MSGARQPDFGTRFEAHFGDRVVRCFRRRPGSAFDMFAEAVRRNGAGEALACGDARLSWNQLNEAVLRCAGGLAARGIRRGDRVALLLSNRSEFVIAGWALAALGAIMVPISTREQLPGVLYLVNQCAAAAIVHDGALADRLPPRADAPALRLRIGADPCPGSEDFAALLEAEPLAAPQAVGEEDVAAILYTSGTTGRPKGAMLTHLNFVHSAMHYELHMQLTPADRCACVVPLSHVTGLVALMVAAARCAGTLLVAPAFKASEFIAWAERERMTMTIMVPAMYNLCLLEPDFAGRDLSHWRIGGYGGAPMPVAAIEALAAKFPNLRLVNAYGSTETTSPSTMTREGDALIRSHTVGCAVECAEIRVMDDDGREVAAGEPGEVWLRGPMVVKGYWDNPDATRDNFIAGFWRSGDIGSLDGDGYLAVFDRRKDMLNRGGYKIYSVEVENALAAHPQVIEAAVVGKPCPVLGERVHVYVYAREPERVSERELIAFCAARLADYKVPESVTVVGEPLPRNPNGKLLKRELRERLLASLR